MCKARIWLETPFAEEGFYLYCEKTDSHEGQAHGTLDGWAWDTKAQT